MKYGVAAVIQIWLAAARIETADCDLREYDWRRRCSGGGASLRVLAYI
jgi:hypothetical protein